MAFCLPKFAADALIAKLPEDLSKLTDISSEERRKFFADIVGESNAKETNALFESKLILKDQQQGIINWVKKVTGMTPQAKTDLISKVSKMTEVLQPKDKQMFLEDLAAHKLGMGVTIEEAGRIADLAKKVEDTKSIIDANGKRTEYGKAKVDFHNYVNDLKVQAEKSKPTTIIQKISNIAGQTKAIKASMDDSAVFRQGWKTMITNPGIWATNALKSISNIVRQFGGKNVMDEVNAEIVSRPNYERMIKAKLDVGTIEEAFPTTLPEKIPLFGRAYKASEVGFTAFVHQIRADVFDKYIEIAQKSGVDINDETQLKSIGNLVNSLTGRGSLGRVEPVAGIVNNVFFSPRFLKSQFDVLTAHTFQKDVTPFVRKTAAINLVKIIAAQAAIMTIANILQPKSAETDPRSSDFGKIRVGSTRFDVSGGASSLITLAARLITLSSKSTVTGKINPINSGKFGAQTGTDVVYNFFENKLSPATSVIKDLLKGQTFQGTKPTVLNEAGNVLVPFPIQNLYTNSDPKAANLILIMMADAMGINASTYTTKKP